MMQKETINEHNQPLKVALSKFSQSLGITVEVLTENSAKLRLTPKEDVMNAFGIIHGGIIATLADTCMGMILRAADVPSVTLELAINYLGVTKPGDQLIAEGQVIHFGGTVITTQCLICSDSGRKIAFAKGTFFHRKQH
jgi:acyl-CoA thioesterase